ncbi:MAG: cyclodeaminase/cyclohydrolase family protein [Defluviitaleaceae bacterium]|nr:cyclodeaminase/cyclohydrolase family protein [Defluviitaleaceae bacterium]
MELSNLKIDIFLEKLASKEPAPGGGAVSALCGALGTSLTTMVANLTIGKKKYLEYDEVLKEMVQGLSKIKDELIDNIEKDAVSFTAVTDAMALPKSTEEEKIKRTEQIQEALKNASKVPVDIMLLCKKGLELSKIGVGKSNPHVITDLGAAAIMFDSAIKTSFLNVLINLASIKDENFVNEIRKKADELLKNGEELSKEIHEYCVDLILN